MKTYKTKSHMTVDTKNRPEPIKVSTLKAPDVVRLEPKGTPLKEPIVYGFDEMEYRRFKSNVKTRAEDINKFLKSIEKNLKEEITAEDLSDFPTSGQKLIKAITAGYQNYFTKTGVPGEILSDFLDVIIMDIKEKRSRFINRQHRLNDGWMEFIQCITLKDNQIKLDPKAVKAQKMRFAKAVKTEEGKVFYEKQIAAEKAINDFLELFPDPETARRQLAYFFIEGKEKPVKMQPVRFDEIPFW